MTTSTSSLDHLIPEIQAFGSTFHPRFGVRNKDSSLVNVSESMSETQFNKTNAILHKSESMSSHFNRNGCRVEDRVKRILNTITKYANGTSKGTNQELTSCVLQSFYDIASIIEQGSTVCDPDILTMCIRRFNGSKLFLLLTSEKKMLLFPLIAILRSSKLLSNTDLLEQVLVLLRQLVQLHDAKQVTERMFEICPDVIIVLVSRINMHRKQVQLAVYAVLNYIYRSFGPGPHTEPALQRNQSINESIMSGIGDSLNASIDDIDLMSVAIGAMEGLVNIMQEKMTDIVITILDCMKRHSHHEIIQHKALGVFLRVIYNNGFTAEVFVSLGMVPTIYKTMQLHQQNEGIQMKGCGLLKHLAIDEDIRRTFMTQETVQVIVQAMRSFNTSCEVQRSAIATLWVLTSDTIQFFAHIVCKESLDDIHVSVFRAMETNLQDEFVQKHGISVLKHLARNKELKSALISAPYHILNAMNAHQFNVLLQSQAIQALNIVSTRASFKYKLLEQGAYQYVVGAMIQFPQEELLQIRGCFALRSFMHSRKSLRTTLDILEQEPEGLSGVVKLLNATMENHRKIKWVQQGAICVLDQLIRRHSNILTVVDIAGFSIIEAMSTHIDDIGLQRAGCNLLMNLTSNVSTFLEAPDQEAIAA